MKALVVGGAGFIGSHTADALLSLGYDVRVIDALVAPVHPESRPPAYLDARIDFIHADARDRDAMEEALHGCDVVYHFAAFQDYLPVFSRYFDVNVTSTALLYEIIVDKQLPVRKVIVASSQATLGEGLYVDRDGNRFLPDIRPLEQLERGAWEIEPPPGASGPVRWERTDESVSNPQNQYGISKIAQEKVALSLGRRYDIPSVAMRYSIVQGPRQSFYNAYSGACRIFCLSFHQGLEPDIYEDGQQVRDFVNIDDVVDANLLVLDDDRADGEMFHVGGDVPMTVAEFASRVAASFGVDDYEPRASGRFRFGDTRHICSDVSKLRGLGWSASRTVDESIERYRAWLAEAPSVAEILARAREELTRLNVVRTVTGAGEPA